MPEAPHRCSEILDRLADPEEGLGFDRATLQQLMDSGQIRWSGQPADQPSNEGILFPETYRIEADADEEAVLRKLVGQLEAVMTELDVASAQERFNLTPYEVLDRRVAHRGGDEGRRRARPGRPGDLQPAQPGDPARDRRHLALRGRAGRPRPRGHRLRERLALQHPPHRRAAAHADRRARAGPASRRPSTPPTGRGSTTCSRTPRATTSSPTATASSSPPRSAAATPGWAAGSA